MEMITDHCQKERKALLVLAVFERPMDQVGTDRINGDVAAVRVAGQGQFLAIDDQNPGALELVGEIKIAVSRQLVGPLIDPSRNGSWMEIILAGNLGTTVRFKNGLADDAKLQVVIMMLIRAILRRQKTAIAGITEIPLYDANSIAGKRFDRGGSDSPAFGTVAAAVWTSAFLTCKLLR